MTHLVLTGHDKHKQIIKAADVVTDMKLVKHSYYQGVLAQKGIDF
jgi:cob(I)alamin adenosyltransferase